VTSNRPASRARAILLAAAGATLCALFAASGAHAQHRDDHADRRAEHVDRRPDRIDRQPGRIDRRPERFDREREHVDARFHHDRVYYNRGVVVSALPRAHYDVVHGGRHFYYSGGIWYAPRGPRWVVIAPPFGAYVPVLPPFYTTLWVGRVPYYYADDAYYVYRGPDIGYEVVAPPPDASVSAQQAPGAEQPAAPPSTELYIYPKNGQNDQQQAQDRYECHSWASSQTGFDPTAANGGVAPDQTASTRAEYDRAMTACLEARGYTVK